MPTAAADDLRRALLVVPAAAVQPGYGADLRGPVTELVAAHGVAAVARFLGCGREPIARLMAGLPIRKGTVLVMREGLRQMAEAA